MINLTEFDMKIKGALKFPNETSVNRIQTIAIQRIFILRSQVALLTKIVII